MSLAKIKNTIIPSTITGSQSDVRFILALLAVSLAFNVALAREWWRARPSAEASLAAIPVGKSVAPLRVRTLEGKEATIAYSTHTQPTVLYVFKPSCPWCLRNLENIKSLVAQKGSAFRFI